MIASKIVGRRVKSVTQERLPAESSKLSDPNEWDVSAINFEGGGFVLFVAYETNNGPIVKATYHPGRRS